MLGGEYKTSTKVRCRVLLCAGVFPNRFCIIYFQRCFKLFFS